MTTPNQDRIFAMIREDMKRAEDQMRHLIEVELFKPSGRPSVPVKPPTRWYRWRVAIRIYFQTLWLALKGVDLYEARDDDDC